MWLMLLSFASSWSEVGPSWSYVEPSWGHVGRSWGHVGPMLGHLGAMLGPGWAILGASRAYVGPSWAYVGPMWAQACPYLSLMLTHVARIWVDVGPMLTSRPSRCPIFRSGPRPKTQNHEKPTVFARRQDETGRRRRPQNPVKNDVFEHHTQNTL